MVTSLPKHIILYNAFGWEPPKFAHLPLLLSKERKNYLNATEMFLL